MAEFKPMVKMETTEPSVILKLKKGGSVKKAMGGALPMPARREMLMPDRRAMLMPTRRAMPASMMKEGGKADMAQDKRMIKKAFKQHDMQEHESGKGTTLKLKTGGVPHGQGGYNTGGVVEGQGGYKKGGGIKKYAKGGMIDTGRPEQMSQGKKKPSRPVAINELAGTFKKGGSAMC